MSILHVHVPIELLYMYSTKKLMKHLIIFNQTSCSLMIHMTMKHICGARLSSGLYLNARFFATDAKMPSTFDFRTVYSIGEKKIPYRKYSTIT